MATVLLFVLLILVAGPTSPAAGGPAWCNSVCPPPPCRCSTNDGDGLMPPIAARIAAMPPEEPSSAGPKKQELSTNRA
ncbi:hypothetical protein EJB05_29779, partial [Eragrostis curvula]